MEPDRQPLLLDIAEQPARPVPPKLKPIDRSQGLLRTEIVEELVAPDYKVRAL